MGGSVETDNGHLFKVRNFETGVMHRRTTSVAEHGCLRKDYYQRRTTKVVHDVNTSLSHRSYLGRFQAQPPILTPTPLFSASTVRFQTPSYLRLSFLVPRSLVPPLFFIQLPLLVLTTHFTALFSPFGSIFCTCGQHAAIDHILVLRASILEVFKPLSILSVYPLAN